VVLLGLVVLVVARTDWRHAGTELDQQRKAGQMVVASLGLIRRRPWALWFPALVVGVASTVTLGLQKWLLRAQPGDDLTDVYGLTDNLAGLGGALAVEVLLLPVVAFAMASTASPPTARSTA
jgi:hypothetical protein